MGICKLLVHKVLCIEEFKSYYKYSKSLEVISGDFNSVKTFKMNLQSQSLLSVCVCVFIIYHW